MMDRGEDELAFERAIPEVFSFLVNDYGFSPIAAQGEMAFEASNEYLHLNWELDWNCIVLCLRPHRQYIRSWKSHKTELGLGVLIDILEPGTKTSLGGSRLGMSEEEVWSNAREIVPYMLKYCESFLRGDFSNWPTKKQVKSFLKHVKPTGLGEHLA